MKTNFVILGLLFLSACGIEPKPIDYGKEACRYCKMTIVDQQHAAEIVSKKGKVFKYDAIECMLRDEENNNSDFVALYLVMDYKKPNHFIDATDARYIVCKKIPSPMGEYLSAFENKDLAEREAEDSEFQLYTWSMIRHEF
jgi:copper chaperone NosL